MRDRGDAFDDRMREAAKDYNAPPPAPREAMWLAIREARSRESARGRGRYTAWTRRAIGLAAAVVIGIALGRTTAMRAPTDDFGVTAESSSGRSDERSVEPGLYQLAATEHLGQAEALLVQFRAVADDSPVDVEVVGWARELLLTTRLLVDSPAGQEPEIRALLEDLELVLAQIVQLPGAGATEREMIEQGIEGRHVLLRLRAVVPAGPVRGGA